MRTHGAQVSVLTLLLNYPFPFEDPLEAVAEDDEGKSIVRESNIYSHSRMLGILEGEARPVKHSELPHIFRLSGIACRRGHPKISEPIPSYLLSYPRFPTLLHDVRSYFNGGHKPSQACSLEGTVTAQASFQPHFPLPG